MKELKSMCALRTCGTAVTLEERSSLFQGSCFNIKLGVKTVF